MKILMIEDDMMLADSLKVLLEEKGFDVECVCNGEDGAAFAETGIYDLLILDVMIPKMNGYEVTKRLRTDRCRTPILMLNAGSELNDEIEGLNAGADYYLTRPFDNRMLLACVNALLRRQGPQFNELSVGNTSLNLSNSTLTCGENSVRLSSKEYDVMRCLMSSQGQILPKELILCRVWGFNSNAVENHVEVYVGLLRKKLRQIGSNVRIAAVRRLGYIVEADMSL